MRVKFAPLVFARTAFVDFRPAFLAAPSEMDEAARSGARDHVLAAMQHPDLVRGAQRWAMFQVGKHLVAGVVASGLWLSDEHTHDLDEKADGSTLGRRTLHAFVGAVYPLTSQRFLPPRAQSFYRDIYAQTVGPRFYERLSVPDWQKATDMAYESIALDPVDPVDPIVPPEDRLGIYPADREEELWRAVAAGGGLPSLCTNAPGGRSKARALFGIVTSPDATDVRHEPRAAKESQREPAEPPPRGFEDRSGRGFDGSHDLDNRGRRRAGKSAESHSVEDWDRKQGKKKLRESPTSSSIVPWLSGTTLLLLGLAVLLWALRKD